MKTTSVLFLFLLAVVLLGTGCTKDDEDIEPAAVLLRSDYLGTYDVTESCTGGTLAYVSTITAGSSGNRININNLFDIGDNVVATIDDDVLTIEEQTDNSRTYSGSGTYADGIITIRYFIDRPFFTDQNCVATYQLQ